MGKYEDLAQQVVEKIGGAENIRSVTHCTTRLRFKVRDESKADDDAIRGIKGVVSVVNSAGQHQVVIGTHVGDVYQDVCAVAHITGDGEVEAAPDEVDDMGEKKGVSAVLLDYIMSTMGPLISVLCGCGILTGIVEIISMTGVLAPTDTLYMILDNAGDVVTTYLPVLIGFTLAKRCGMSPILGMCFGLIFCDPDLQNMENATLFGINVSGFSYTSSMLPIVVTILVAAPFDRLLKRVLPKSISSFIEPVILFAVVSPIAFAVIGPVMTFVATAIANVVQVIYGFSPILCGLVLGAAWQVLVLFGVHFMLATIIYPLLFATGSSFLLPLTCISSFAIMGITFAMFLRSKDQKVKEVAFPATVSALFGITEPAMYGLLLPQPKYMVIACVASGIVGAVMGIVNVVAYQPAGLGIFSVTMALSDQNPSNILYFVVAMAAATVLGFIAAFIAYRGKAGEQELAA